MSLQHDVDLMDVNNWKVLIVDDVFDNIAIAKAILIHNWRRSRNCHTR